MTVPTVISEQDSTGRTRRILLFENEINVWEKTELLNLNFFDTIEQVTGTKDVSSHHGPRLDQHYILDILRKMFLPAGYPNTVSPGAWLLLNKCNKRLT